MTTKTVDFLDEFIPEWTERMRTVDKDEWYLADAQAYATEMYSEIRSEIDSRLVDRGATTDFEKHLMETLDTLYYAAVESFVLKTWIMERELVKTPA